MSGWFSQPLAHQFGQLHNGSFKWHVGNGHLGYTYDILESGRVSLVQVAHGPGITTSYDISCKYSIM